MPAISLNRLNRPSRERGFTLAECLVAIVLATTAGGALMLAMGSSVETTRYTLDRVIAGGIAEQVMDEVVGSRYAADGVGPTQWPLGIEGPESAGNGRELYDDTDDFDDYTATPPKDDLGYAVGTRSPFGNERHDEFQIPGGYVEAWTQEVDVYYVDESDPSVRLADGFTSKLRAVEVRILEPTDGGSTRPLVTLRRVFGYVPSL